MEESTSSRRSLRRRGRLLRVLGFGVLGLLLALVIGVFFAYQWFQKYVRSEEFRALVEAQASKFLQAEVKLDPLEWNRLDVLSKHLQAGSAPAFSKLEADRLKATLRFNGWSKRSWTVEGAMIENLVVDFKKAAAPAGPASVKASPAPASAPPAEVGSSLPGWLPTKVEVPQVRVRNTNLRFGTGDMDFRVLGSEATLVERGDGSYDIDLRGGLFSVAPFPGAGITKKNFSIGSAKARLGTDAVYLVESTLRAEPSTTSQEGEDKTGLSIEGTIPFSSASHKLSLHINMEDLPVGQVVGPQWTNRVFGRLALDFKTTEDEKGRAIHEGTVRLADARFLTPEPEQPKDGGLVGMVRGGWETLSGTVLPVLGAYTDHTRQFRNLICDTARARFRRSGDTLELHDLEIVSRGLLSLEGDVEIRGRDLSGLVRVGVTRATLSGIPGAEAKVFTTERDGLLWTPVRLSGTLDDPKEDLTQRLLDAAGQRVIEAVPEIGFGLIRGAGQAVKEGAGLLENGGKVIETGTGILAQGGRLIEGLLGPGQKPAEKAPEKAPDKKDEKPPGK